MLASHGRHDCGHPVPRRCILWEERERETNTEAEFERDEGKQKIDQRSDRQQGAEIGEMRHQRRKNWERPKDAG